MAPSTALQHKLTTWGKQLQKHQLDTLSENLKYDKLCTEYVIPHDWICIMFFLLSRCTRCSIIELLFKKLSRVTQPSWSTWSIRHRTIWTYFVENFDPLYYKKAWTRCNPSWCPGTCRNLIRLAHSFRVNFGPSDVCTVIPCIQWLVTAMYGI